MKNADEDRGARAGESGGSPADRAAPAKSVGVYDRPARAGRRPLMIVLLVAVIVAAILIVVVPRMARGASSAGPVGAAAPAIAVARAGRYNPILFDDPRTRVFPWQVRSPVSVF